MGREAEIREKERGVNVRDEGHRHRHSSGKVKTDKKPSGAICIKPLTLKCRSNIPAINAKAIIILHIHDDVSCSHLDLCLSSEIIAMIHMVQHG